MTMPTHLVVYFVLAHNPPQQRLRHMSRIPGSFRRINLLIRPPGTLRRSPRETRWLKHPPGTLHLEPRILPLVPPFQQLIL